MRAKLLPNGHIVAPVMIESDDVIAHRLIQIAPGHADYADYIDELKGNHRSQARQLHLEATAKKQEATDGPSKT
jgi:hypothetical protein